jgi:hypothetical protein
LTATCLLALSQVANAAEAVGVISFSRGTVAATQVGEASRILGKDAEIFQGDNIQTSERSFVIITFNDGTKITVRPESNFSVDEFSSENKKAKLTVHSGGIRANSGDIAKESTENLQISTPHTTVKAQQAEFSIRVCDENNCQQEEAKLAEKEAIPSNTEVVARVIEIKGDVTAMQANKPSQASRLLKIGAPLYQTDKITAETESYAVIVFKDRGRITVEPSSSFNIANYAFNSNSDYNASYELLTGAMRVLTGTIGKEDKEAFKVNTPVATIGIRGTGFDLLYQIESGLYTKVWKGAIYEQNEAGIFELSEPKVNLIKNKSTKPIPVPDIPLANQLVGPRPDLVIVENEPELFKVVPIKPNKAGTFVDVHNGHVKVLNGQGRYVDLGAGEASFSYINGETVRIEIAPKILQYDPYPLPSDGFNENLAEVTTFSLLNDNMSVSGSGDVLQCECK